MEIPLGPTPGTRYKVLVVATSVSSMKRCIRLKPSCTNVRRTQRPTGTGRNRECTASNEVLTAAMGVFDCGARYMVAGSPRQYPNKEPSGPIYIPKLPSPAIRCG